MPVSDDQDELFDLVNEDDRVIGKIKRGEAHKDKNLIHRSISIAVFNKKNEVYLQQRSATKDMEPGKWTISCSGHVLSGQNYKETAFRELKEELGRNLDLKLIAKYLCQGSKETEIVTLFQTFSNGPFHLNKTEIKRGNFFTQQKLKEALQKKEINLTLTAELALTKLKLL